MRIYYGMLPCAKTCRIYMFALHKPAEEPFSEGSEAVVLLSVSLVAFLWAVYIGVICRLLRLGSCEILERVEKISSRYSFFRSMPVSLPVGEVEMSASIDSFRTISFTFEAICGEYLNRTQRASSVSFAPGINWPRGHVSIYPDVAIYRTS